LTQDSAASFSWQCMTSNVIDCLWALKAVNEMMLEVVHQHKKLAPEFGVKFMAAVAGSDFRSMSGA